MPIYEYQCNRCGIFEVSQRITEKPLSKCPTCKAKVKRLISNTSFQLKGTGWYITDYARKGQDTAKSANGAKPESDSKTDSKSESKKAPSGEASSPTNASSSTSTNH
ncbi:MAG TPA: zinc ribbon domain-containing protein [Candidatus Eisenbacteria bacterium]|nr:zinc ribbon domain-containing protein [Candidatus Eisenbacteria bacterium]